MVDKEVLTFMRVAPKFDHSGKSLEWYFLIDYFLVLFLTSIKAVLTSDAIMVHLKIVKTQMKPPISTFLLDIFFMMLCKVVLTFARLTVN